MRKSVFIDILFIYLLLQILTLAYERQCLICDPLNLAKWTPLTPQVSCLAHIM